MNELELAVVNRKAFDALPEPYQNDSCLFFWEENGQLFARPNDDQELALGSWKAVFNSYENFWMESKHVYA